MSEVKPIAALHYDLAQIPSLGDVTAPPYDVIDAEARAALIERSPFNVVELDLPEAPPGHDPYEQAAQTLSEWTSRGILTTDREPSIWALTQDYTGPDGLPRTRRGLLARVRVTDYGPGRIRPHERTQPGPKEDRLKLTRATRHNLSPIFALHPTSVWDLVEPALGPEPWAEVADPEGTTHRVWRLTDPSIHDVLSAALADDELLIADGHHRYETARVYADEVGGEGPHRYTLVCLVSLQDPGLTIFGTHRMLLYLDGDATKRLDAAIEERFATEEVDRTNADPAGEEGIGVFGFARADRALRLRLKDPGALERALPDRSRAYRQLDAAILEELILKDTLGMSDDDIAAKRGLGYTSDPARTLRQLDTGEYEAAFLLRPTPVEQVREVAAAAETMPPKSTYFFPKLLTGIVFNPLR
ncbi:MAG: DUF1015 domain-containing protein [Solirubrobacterales bacterium]